MAKRLPSVVLVGRPNVGKSTLFNRLTRTRRAIVTPIPGTTRDVIAHEAEWQGARFELVDTGGMFGASEDPLHELVFERGRRAIGDADLLVLVVDGREGIVPGDEQIARVLREADTPAILAINKTDDRRARSGVLESHRLGFDPIFEISAEHGEGTGDLDDFRKWIKAGGQVLNLVCDTISAAHVVARDVPLRHQRLQHPHDAGFGDAGRFMDVMNRRNS